MDAKSIRRANLKQLIADTGGQADLGRRTKKDPAYLSQILNDWAGRGMGARFARDLEIALGKPHGWMDQDHAAPKIAQRETTTIHGYFISPEGAQLAAEWEKLREPERSVIERIIYLLVASQKRDGLKSKTGRQRKPAAQLTADA